MNENNQKGDVGETRIISEMCKRGYKVALPFGQDWKYDLIVDRNGKLERIQVKSANSRNNCISVNAYSNTRKNGKSVERRYKVDEIDWVAVYGIDTDECYFVPSKELDNGKGETKVISLRLVPTKNKQQKNVRWARDFKTF